jgi:hypothetical protein
MTMRGAQRALAGTWFGTSFVIVSIVLIQSILGHYSDPAEAWGWVTTNLVPTLSLMVGILVAENVGKAEPDRDVDAFLFQLALGLSLFYLLSLLLTLLLSPFAQSLPLALMKQSQQLWIGPIQGLVTASLGAFFVRSRRGR